MSYDDAPRATLRIEYGSSRGSGFQFIQPDIVLTNHHVIAGAEHNKADSIVAVTEAGERVPLDLLAYAPSDQEDYAILRTKSAIPGSRHVLQPRVQTPVPRGTDVLFSGFPHGIPHLLVQRAHVSGLVSSDVFYLDGSVNGGNSGGPIIDVADGKVIGIVTQRRFLGGADLKALADAAANLQRHCQAIAGRGSVQIMGIDFGGFSRLMAEAMLLIRQTLEANANAGIGIGFSIRFAADRCAALGIKW